MRFVLASLLVFGMLGCSGNAESEACADDRACPAGRFCRSGECVFDCTFDADCPDGFRCTVRGRCERGCVTTNGGVEACDGLDNDCDDAVDEDFVELGQVCSNGGCAEGLWICSADGSSVACDGPHPAADDTACDGADNDCDGQTDEDAPDRDCPLQAGICAGTHETCLGVEGWSACDYGAAYTEGVDDACDQQDNDCDGLTDEDAALILEPEEGVQAGDGLDNNCNGLVDEPGGVMVKVSNSANVWIDVFEISVFENPDCSGQRYGAATDDYPVGWPLEGDRSLELYACSLRGLIPSAYLSWQRARWACEAQGKRLCNQNEWQPACSASEGGPYPYGFTFLPGACNDGWGGTGQAEPTGSLEGCEAGGAYDMSGNMTEWLEEWDPIRTGEALTAGGGFFCELCLVGLDCHLCDPGSDQDRHWIEELSDCKVEETVYDSYPRNIALSYLGTRCCLTWP